VVVATLFNLIIPIQKMTKYARKHACKPQV
jgi:hypothetical protein